MSDDAAIFESETELDIFPPKWKRKLKKKNVPLSWVSDNDI